VKFMGVNGLWPLYDGRMVRKRERPT
jgi:hypothetical protein